MSNYGAPNKVVVSPATSGNANIIAVQLGAGGWSESDVATMLSNASFANGSTTGWGIDTSNGSQTYDQNMTDFSGTIKQAFAKLGPNTLTLTGANNYGGPTFVNGGTLFLPVSNSFLGYTSNNVTVNSGATLAVRLDNTGVNGWPVAQANTLLGRISGAGSPSQWNQQHYLDWRLHWHRHDQWRLHL